MPTKAERPKSLKGMKECAKRFLYAQPGHVLWLIEMLEDAEGIIAEAATDWTDWDKANDWLKKYQKEDKKL